VDTQGLPKVLLTKTVRPESLRLPQDVATAKPSATSNLPKAPQSEDSFRVTIPLSPPALPTKPREMPQINAPDVIVTTAEKAKTPPILPPKAVKSDSFLQPSTAQTAASSSKAIVPARRTKEAAPSAEPLSVPAPPIAKTPISISEVAAQLAANPVTTQAESDGFILAPSRAKEATPAPKIDPLPAPAKLDEPKPFSPIHTVPPMLASAESKEPKKALPQSAPATRKVTIEEKPPFPAPGDMPPAQTVPCPSAKYSMYVGLASIFLPFFGLITAIAAIVLGHSALNKIKQSRGMLTGRQSAVLGLYFGYITLVLISGYSILFYFLFYSSSSTENLVHSASTPASITLTTPSPTPTNPPPATTETAPTPPAPANPAPSDMLAPAPHVTSPDLQPATASTPTPPGTPPAADVTTSTTATAPVTPPSPEPAATAPATPPAPPTVISDSTGGNAAALLQSNIPSTTSTNAAPASASALTLASVPASTSTPAVYDPVVQNRLKDGMLSQPMPQDASSRAYMDDESFNNCARILARPPEAKYAESVGDFLDDVKTRNPDPARLQILSAMYENYMAGIKREP